MRVGILTSGGDCQALNATMRSVGKSLYKKMPATWLEHATLWLQIRCYTNWAKPAHYYSSMRVKGLEPPRRKAPDPKSGASANSAKPAIMTRTGLEPVTHWLKVNCSTNWANESYHYLLETSFLSSADCNFDFLSITTKLNSLELSDFHISQGATPNYFRRSRA